MTEPSFTNREIDAKLKAQNDDMKDFMKGLIEPLTAQVTYTNGRVRKLYVYLTILGTATVTLLFTNGSELVNFLLKII